MIQTVTKQIGVTMLLCLFMLGAAPASGQTASNEELRREWLTIQSSSDRRLQAAWWRELDIHKMRRLADAGVLLDVRDKRGWTPLHSAARFNTDSRILVILLDGGADVHAKDKAGDTPLHWAAAQNTNVQVVRELISAGADVNAVDRYGWLPIHTAVESNANPDIARELLDSGSHRHRRAYFLLFGPRFLLRHNPNMSKHDKLKLLEELKSQKAETAATVS